MFTQEEQNKINQYYHIALDRITKKHITCLSGMTKPVLVISEEYPGVWLEHVYDAIFLAQMDHGYLPIAKNTLELFLDHQKSSGQLPFCVVDRNQGETGPRFGYSQTQECVPIARLCFEYYEMSGDVTFLRYTYEKCIKWEAWYENYRMPSGKGLVEMFCGFDTGHDNSGRLEGITYQGKAKDNDATVYPEGDAVLPMIAPDINAVFYGTLTALYDMAVALGKEAEAEKWENKAGKVKKALIQTCYDEADQFFYDVDKHGDKRKYLSISITNVFSEHLMDQEMAEEVYERHMRNPEEFFTEYPFPSMAKSDSVFRQNRSGNSWGFYSQALTILRCTRWMDYYGKSDDLNYILQKWVRQWTFHNTIMFGQELNPLTGEPSDCSEYYSSCMLVYIYAVRRLGVTV